MNLKLTDSFLPLKGQRGIYGIVFDNNVTKRIYVGQSTNLNLRLYRHKYSLLHNKHYNKYLQATFNKYGANHFCINILGYCQEKELSAQEQYWLDFYAKEQGWGVFNFGDCVNNPFRGKSHTQETKSWLSTLAKGRKYSDERNRKISKALRGRRRDSQTCNNIRVGAISAHDSEKRTVVLVNPAGEVVTVLGVRAFCKRAAISRTGINGVIGGSIKSCKGWRLFDGNNDHPFCGPIGKGRALSPEKKSQKIRESRLGKAARKNWARATLHNAALNLSIEVTNISKFCRIYRVPSAGVSKIINQKTGKYKNWEVVNVEPLTSLPSSILVPNSTILV